MLLGCLGLSSLGRREVPYKELSKNLKLIGRGGQGQVYNIVVSERTLALKQFKTKKETENYHLLYLDHLHLIKFLLVVYIHLFSLTLQIQNRKVFLFLKVTTSCAFFLCCTAPRLSKVNLTLQDN